MVAFGMDDKPIDFRNERERRQWMMVYEQAMKDGSTPYSSAERADEDMAIRRRVYPPVGDMDIPLLLDVARAALNFKRLRLDPSATDAVAEVIEQIEWVDQLRGDRP